MGKVNFVRFRDNLAEYANLAKYAHERIIVTRNGKDVGAFVPIDDLEALQALEDQADIEVANESMKRNSFENWADVKKEMRKHHL